MKYDRENELYYLENGKVVFTPLYHINRGYCCGNVCRHCPYNPKHITNNIKLDKEWQNNQQKGKN